MGAGKSTVGQLLAARTGRPFLDTDESVEATAGRTVREVFEAEGEAAFREREADALARAADVPGAVVAVGGGAVVSGANRRLMREAGEVVWLTGSPAVLAARLSGDSSRPLLDGGDPGGGLEALLTARREAYSDCDRRVDTVGRTPEEVTDAVLALPLRAEHAAHRYEVHVLPGGADNVAVPLQRVLGGAGRAFVVADARAAHEHGADLGRGLKAAGLSWTAVRLDASESAKTLATATGLWQHMASSEVDRDVPLLAFGGGVTCDVGGFVASTFKRGVPWVAVATTLLAMVDAAVGGKTGVDLPGGKNLVGTFHPPVAVLMPVGCLATLPERELRAGLSEAVKTALVGDPALLDLLEREREAVLAREPSVLADVVRRCVAVKAAVVAQDPEERTGVRRTLNLGHTAGHAIEAAAGYQGVTHGEAVALGIVLAARVAVEAGNLTPDDASRIESILRTFGLPTDTSRWGQGGVEEWRMALRQDKKRLGGRVHYVVPDGVGRVRQLALDPDDLLARLARAASARPGGGT